MMILAALLAGLWVGAVVGYAMACLAEAGRE